jgi:hypothetical protein
MSLPLTLYRHPSCLCGFCSIIRLLRWLGILPRNSYDSPTSHAPGIVDAGQREIRGYPVNSFLRLGLFHNMAVLCYCEFTIPDSRLTSTEMLLALVGVQAYPQLCWAPRLTRICSYQEYKGISPVGLTQIHSDETRSLICFCVGRYYRSRIAYDSQRLTLQRARV